IRFALAKPWYFAEVLLDPFPLALAATGAAALFTPAYAAALLGFAALVALLRIGQTVILDGATGGFFPSGAALLTPIKDLLHFALHATGFTSREVEWHGHRVRLGPGSRILPPDEERDPALAAAH
ncbi:MAG TPA: hypothetical protein VKF32_15420, partial [Thermoanaerobaculia bacterium]|nr:hypothetical protein [Thermoanaerobaculia bacterium]